MEGVEGVEGVEGGRAPEGRNAGLRFSMTRSKAKHNIAQHNLITLHGKVLTVLKGRVQPSPHTWVWVCE